MFSGLKWTATAKNQRGIAHLKSGLKTENKSYNHFTPIEGQTNALFIIKDLSESGYPNS